MRAGPTGAEQGEEQAARNDAAPGNPAPGPRRIVRIAMVAGEKSGDLLGSRVLRALVAAFPKLDIRPEGIGGEALQAEGLHSLYPMERLAVMGLVEPLGRLPELLRIRRELAERWTRDPPAFFLGIDAPDFNLGLAHRLRRAGVRTVQLVSPTVWAWRSGRVHSVARAVERLLCLFPFEPPLYRNVDVKAVFVGHPLVREFRDLPDRAAARAALDLDPRAPVIALLPGSRSGEVERLAGTLLEAGRLLRSRDPRRVLVMPAANRERLAQCRAIVDDLGAGAELQLVEGHSRDAMIAADLVLLASGTASLEAMLLRRPMVLTYRLAPLSWALMSRLAATPYVGLPNILAGRQVVPELLQDDLSAPALALAAETLLREGAAQVQALDPCRESLARDFDSATVAALEDLLVHGG